MNIFRVTTFMQGVKYVNYLEKKNYIPFVRVTFYIFSSQINTIDEEPKQI